MREDRYLIDIHNHLLPGFDDGAKDWDVALAMLQAGMDDGIKEAILTPHIMSQKDLEKEEEIFVLFEKFKLKAAKEGIQIKFHLACELFIQPDMDLNRRLTTLDELGRYFLVEFPMSIVPEFVTEQFFKMIIDNKIPIVAHPERNVSIIQNPERAVDLVEHGALLQMNAGSLLGKFGSTVRDVANLMMDANLIHFVASDSHDTRSRPFKLSEAYYYIEENWGKDRAEHLLCINPRKVLESERINPPDPLPERLKAKKKRFVLFKRKI